MKGEIKYLSSPTRNQVNQSTDMQSDAATTLRVEDPHEKKQVIFLGLMHASKSSLRKHKKHLS